MDVTRVLRELEDKYPGKKIIKNDENNTTEIICEIEPSTDHPEHSLAVAVVDRSFPHVHKKTKETYKVLKGALKIFKDGGEVILTEGEKITVIPEETHWAEGSETWVECYSEPGWTFEDHILVEEK